MATQKKMILRISHLLSLAAAAAITAQATAAADNRVTITTKLDLHAGPTGYYTFDGLDGPSPDINVTVGQTLVFEQHDVTNWYHPLGFAFYPDGAHGETWGGDERAEVEELDQIQYYKNGERACTAADDFGLDCYEPDFFWPLDTWSETNYAVELTITPELADAAIGGVLYYFCHIHSKMSGKIVIHNETTGSRVAGTGTEQELYPTVTVAEADAVCGTYGIAEYATGGHRQCEEQFLCGALDSTFETCLQAMDCQMNQEMRVAGHDSHGDSYATFCQQMIPHHENAVNMAKLVLKTVSTEKIEKAELFDMLLAVVNDQNFQIHEMKNYLGAHEGHINLHNEVDGKAYGPHCNVSEAPMFNAVVAAGMLSPSNANSATGTDDARLFSEDSGDVIIKTKVDVHAGPTGYYTFDGLDGPSPNINVKVGQTLVFEQLDVTNWYHPLGFAFYPDGAHGETWGGDERAEVEELDQIQYYKNGKRACTAADDFGLDCYEPDFFFPRGDFWEQNAYRVELTITPELADAAIGGVLYYFCHIHSKMSGKIVIHDESGSRVAGTGTEQELYPTPTLEPADQACGTFGITPFVPTQANACDQNFLCGMLDTTYEVCLQAIDCQMNQEMKVAGFDTHADPLVTFCQQMIPHHTNAVNMAKAFLTTSPSGYVSATESEEMLTTIINAQNAQIHRMRNFLAAHEDYSLEYTAESVGNHCPDDAAVEQDERPFVPSPSAAVDVAAITTVAAAVGLFF